MGAFQDEQLARPALAHRQEEHRGIDGHASARGITTESPAPEPPPSPAPAMPPCAQAGAPYHHGMHASHGH